MRKPTKYSVLLTCLILIAVAVLVFLYPNDDFAAIFFAIVMFISATSLAGIILASREIYVAKDLKNKMINVPCLIVFIVTFVTPGVFIFLVGSGP
ncbi:hypothetical protein [Halobacillus naozhouensis]|uniref:Uncharacterized protein n=1 Tax=Halobacillus naozhouensis TaxID=554880 RepID=A0ABY8IWA4_9BACI|nr:hypothetical protein [Halobacillus naozhouensis]WFT73609.1 hypothetical protein P9989_14670 [Halobacillus naozhouensis]